MDPSVTIFRGLFQMQTAHALLDLHARARKLLKALIHAVEPCIDVIKFVSESAHHLVAPPLLLRQGILALGNELRDIAREHLL